MTKPCGEELRRVVFARDVTVHRQRFTQRRGQRLQPVEREQRLQSVGSYETVCAGCERLTGACLRLTGALLYCN